MKSELSSKTVVCNTYERLLQRCMATLEVWASRRQETCEAGSGNKESSAELLRLQADYAKSYNDLCKHVGRCESCQLISFTTMGMERRTTNCCTWGELPNKRNGLLGSSKCVMDGRKFRKQVHEGEFVNRMPCRTNERRLTDRIHSGGSSPKVYLRCIDRKTS